MANRLLDARDAPRVSTRWAMNFVKRQPLLKVRFARRYDYLLEELMVPPQLQD
jgi:hypothetical protein